MEVKSALVSAHWLQAHCDDSDLIVFMSTMNDITTGAPEPAPEGYIPGARLFDFEHQVCDPNSSLPHTMPSPEEFEQEVRKLGVNNLSVIVVYDNQGLFTAPRVWWMFKCMGHEQVYILDGGYSAWQKEGGKSTSSLITSPPTGDFTSQFKGSLLIDYQGVSHALDITDSWVVDARAAGRFNGAAPEPRPHLRSGHMPNAVNLPFTHCIEQGRLLSPDSLRDKFAALGIKEGDQLIFSCGSGVTACVLALAAHEAGYKQLSVYDGSWSEWGANHALPVVC